MSKAHHLYFVCTGNICRSPMAEVLAAWYAERRGRPVEVRSGGTLGIENAPADNHAIEVCEELGVDLRGHRSSPITADDIAWSDWILVMELAHANKIRDRFPDADNKLLMLGTFGGSLEISDPIGANRYRFRTIRDEIRRSIEVFVDRLPPRK